MPHLLTGNEIWPLPQSSHWLIQSLLKLLILSTEACFQLKIRKYMLTGIFSKFQKSVYVFENFNNKNFWIFKIPWKSFKNTLSQAFEDGNIFWKFLSFNFLRYNEILGKFSNSSKNFKSHWKLNDGSPQYCMTCLGVRFLILRPLNLHLKIFLEAHFLKVPRTFTKKWNQVY